MRNKKKNRIFLLLILLLGLGIGFAALATTLKINGTTIINKNTWNIYWDNIDNETGVTPTSISIDDEDENHLDNIVSFNVTFDKPGDYFEFTVDAVNAGTLDAEILSIVKKYNNTEIPEVEDPNNRVVPAYLKYELTYEDGSAVNIGDKLLKAEDLTSNPQVLTKKTFKVRVEYDRDAVTNEDVNNQVDTVYHSFEFKVQYGQATPTAGPAGPVAFATDSWDTIAAEGNRAATQTEVTNNTCGAYHIGDTKVITMDLDEDETDESYTVRIANCSTPAVCSTSGFSQTACGFVVEFADIFDGVMMNYHGSDSAPGAGSYGSWPATQLRAYLNNGTYDLTGREKDYTSTGLLSKLPSDLVSQLADTTVVSGHGYTNDPDNFTSTDKLFLLAPHEVYLDVNGNTDVAPYLIYLNRNTDYNSTRQLDYYESIGVTTNNYSGAKKKNVRTDAYDEWWLRSPRASANDLFYNVGENGYCDYNYANTASGITPTIGASPAFKLK